MPTRAQNMISKSTRAVEFARVRSDFEAQVREGEVGAAQRLFAFHEYTAEHSGDWVLAQPWMEDGELCMSSIEELYNFVLRSGLRFWFLVLCLTVSRPVKWRLLDQAN